MKRITVICVVLIVLVLASGVSRSFAFADKSAERNIVAYVPQ